MLPVKQLWNHSLYALKKISFFLKTTRKEINVDVSTEQIKIALVDQCFLFKSSTFTLDYHSMRHFSPYFFWGGRIINTSLC